MSDTPQNMRERLTIPIAQAIESRSPDAARRADQVQLVIDAVLAELHKPDEAMIKAVEFAIYRYSDCDVRDAERGAPHACAAMINAISVGK